MADLWLPGQGYVPSHVRQAQQALREYNEDLSLAKDGDQWVVLMNRGPQPFPVLGLGFDLPAPEEIKRQLYMGDTQRRGHLIAKEVDAHNEAIKRELRHKTNEGAGEFAEALDTARHIKKIHQAPRIFVPSAEKD